MVGVKFILCTPKVKFGIAKKWFGVSHGLYLSSRYLKNRRFGDTVHSRNKIKLNTFNYVHRIDDMHVFTLRIFADFLDVQPRKSAKKRGKMKNERGNRRFWKFRSKVSCPPQIRSNCRFSRIFSMLG